jgi:putative flippase GtrA
MITAILFNIAQEGGTRMTSLTERLNTKEPQRFARFLVVGAVGTLLDFGVLALLKTFGLPTILANTISFSAGVANNFTWNRLWTFADAKSSDWRVQLAQFMLVSVIGLALNNLIVLALEQPLGDLLERSSLGYLPAKVIATGTVVFWNYFANHYWTFKPSSAKSG